MNRTESAAAWDAFFSPRRFLLALGVLIAACFVPVLFGFQSFVFRDFGLFGYPLAHYHRESFWQGEIPLWNPLNNCGLPFMAQWNTMVFYPGSLIYLLLPLPWSLNLFCLLHLYLGGAGMFFLARKWTGSNFAAAFAGLVFSFNGLTLHCLMWPNNIAALGLMPWVLLLVERACTRGGSSLLAAILVDACQFMTGAPEAFLLTWVVAAVLWLAAVDANRAQFLKLFFRFVAIVAGIIALSAVQLLPLIELIQQSQRSSGYDTGGWAMPAWGWANLLVPLFRTVSSGTGVAFQIGQAWTSSYYFGVVTLWLALIAVIRLRNTRVWALALLVLLSLVLALGDTGFIWPLLKHYIGALGFIRYPVKLIFLAAVPLTLLAALGLAELERVTLRRAAGESALSPRLLQALAAVFVTAIGIVLWFTWQHPNERENVAVALVNGGVRALVFAALVAGVLLFRTLSERHALIGAAVWLLVMMGDFLTHMPWQNPTVASSFLAPKVEPLQSLREQAAPGRSRAMLSLAALQHFHQHPMTNLAESYLAHRLGQSHNLNLLEGIAKPDGFFSLYIARQQDVQYSLFPDVNSVHPAVADVMAIGFMTAPEKLFEWSARSNALPMVSVGQQPLFVAEGEMLNVILHSNFNPHTTVLLPANASSIVKATRERAAKVSVEKFHAQEIELKVSTPRPTVVSISQSFYRPWKAYVDEAPVVLWRANQAFQALEVPAGEHRVRLCYEDAKFRFGAWISALTLALLLGMRLLKRAR